MKFFNNIDDIDKEIDNARSNYLNKVRDLNLLRAEMERQNEARQVRIRKSWQRLELLRMRRTMPDTFEELVKTGGTGYYDKDVIAAVAAAKPKKPK